MKINEIKKGQRWRSKDTGKIFLLQVKTSCGWQAKPEGQKKNHHIKEYTLLRFYELLSTEQAVAVKSVTKYNK